MEAHDTELELETARRSLSRFITSCSHYSKFITVPTPLYINRYIQGQRGGLGPKNDVLKTFKAFTL